MAALLQHPLVVLLGGPGTGKTSTVARMLAAALALEPQLRVQLAAPTGKAAARLSAALAKRPSLPCSTLHRLLEARGGSRFARQAANPLELDLLVVDELSMVDLPLMAALLEAMPPQGRLLLVGDAGQLPPVGTGAVLEELCRPAVRAQLGSAVVELTTTYRNNGAIAAIAAAARDQPTRSADPLQGLRPLLHGLEANANLRWLECPLQQLPKAVLTPLRQHQQRLQELSLALQWHGSEGEPGGAAALLAELEQLIALSPVRQGPWGVQALHRALLGPAATGPLERWPLGTPVLNRLQPARAGARQWRHRRAGGARGPAAGVDGGGSAAASRPAGGGRTGPGPHGAQGPGQPIRPGVVAGAPQPPQPIRACSTPASPAPASSCCWSAPARLPSLSPMANVVERPWGWFETLGAGEGYLVKRLCIRAGQRISLQRHHHRSEHWVVVAGTGSLLCASANDRRRGGHHPADPLRRLASRHGRRTRSAHRGSAAGRAAE